MASKRTSKKSISRISPATAKRVVAISLQHPGLGARRLVPLLKKRRISVSLTTVQSILRREGLQNRKMRLAKVKKPAQKPESQPKKPAARIPDKTGERIVELALQNPELGAGRLVVELEKEKIEVSASSVHRILKRSGLETREKRVAEIESRGKKTRKRQSAPQKTRKPKSALKKPAAPIGDDAAGRIVEISLQNPDFGAGRLVPLLEKAGISASAAAVYRILRRRGLQTREQRLAKSAESVTEPVTILKTFPEKIPIEVEDRVVELCLQNPEFGARRLNPLLQQEHIFISASAVYTILRRHDLENRQKRLLRLEDQVTPEIPPELDADVSEPFAEPAEAEPSVPEAEVPELVAEAPEIKSTPAMDEIPEPVFEPAAAAPLPPEIEAPEPAEEPEPLTEPVRVEPAQPERPPVRKTLIPPLKKRSHWVFYPLYLLLLLLIGYLGFNAVQTIQYARLGTEALSTDSSISVGVAAKADASAQPLDGYRQIWQRNLFNTGKAEETDSDQKISLEKIAPAKKDLGLELVGTVVSDDPSLSRAIIDNRSIKKQEAYREGETAGKVKIKKILRNNVVITTAEGDELLTVEIKESGRIAPSALSQRVGSQSSPTQQAADNRQASVRTLSLNLKRDEVAAALADTDKFMEQLTITPYKPGDQPSGFMINRITPQNVLRKMGLRSRDVIVGINGETIASPDQAADFFKKLADGGEVTINFRRRYRSRQIKLNIE